MQLRHRTTTAPPFRWAVTASLMLPLLAVIGCGDSTTSAAAITGADDASEAAAPSTSSAAAQRSGATANLLPAFGFAGTSGQIVLNRRSNGTFSWRLKAEGATPGNAYTLWIGNFNGDGTGNDGGHGSGGLVGGSGKITAAGNHCLHQLDPADPTGSTGGFVPGTAPNCNLVDTSGPIFFFLLDHGPWTPGDVSEFRSPFGDDMAGLAGVLFAVFPAP